MHKYVVFQFAITLQTSLQITQASIVYWGCLVGSLDITSGALIACVILSGRILSHTIANSQH